MQIETYLQKWKGKKLFLEGSVGWSRMAQCCQEQGLRCNCSFHCRSRAILAGEEWVLISGWQKQGCVSFCCCSSAWCSSCSLAVAKHFVRECNWPWNVLWVRSTNSPTLGNLFIANCCLFLSLNLIPFKFLFSKPLKFVWNKDKRWLRSYSGGFLPVGRSIEEKKGALWAGISASLCFCSKPCGPCAAADLGDWFCETSFPLLSKERRCR